MDKIKAWMEKKEEAIVINRQAQMLFEEAQKQPIPDNLRPATPEDITMGNILWYKDGDEGAFWTFIVEVINPSRLFKAYTDYNGCRYGLDGAFVEVKTEASSDFYDLKEEDGRNL